MGMQIALDLINAEEFATQNCISVHFFNVSLHQCFTSVKMVSLAPCRQLVISDLEINSCRMKKSHGNIQEVEIFCGIFLSTLTAKRVKPEMIESSS